MSDWYQDHEEDATVIERHGAQIVVVLIICLLALFFRSIFSGAYSAIVSAL